jgi:CheY-specific phosphatase CheX
MSTRFFGQFLLERGRITSQQLLAGLEAQKSLNEMPMAILALERGWVSPAQIREIIEKQKHKNLRFEQTAVQQGYLTEAQVGELLQLEKTSHRVRLGEALVLKEFVTLESLDRELKEYNKETEHFSAELSNAFAALAHKTIVQTFTDLMLLMFTRFGKQDIIIERCENGKEKVRLFRWVISQKIAGDNVKFNCLLSVPPKLFLQMASTMLDDTISTADELAIDASKEFVNIANGNACAKLSENGVNLTMLPPEIYETTTTPYPFLTKEVVCVHLASPDSKLDVAFEF